jgi:hypothetical protein
MMQYFKNVAFILFSELHTLPKEKLCHVLGYRPGQHIYFLDEFRVVVHSLSGQMTK